MTSPERDVPTERTITEMAVDFWKLLRATERMVNQLPEGKQTRMAAQLRFSSGKLDSQLDALAISLPTFEGSVFGPELPAIAVNAEEVDGTKILIVDSAIEPAVIRDGKVIQNARVILKESEADVSGN